MDATLEVRKTVGVKLQRICADFFASKYHCTHGPFYQLLIYNSNFTFDLLTVDREF